MKLNIVRTMILLSVFCICPSSHGSAINHSLGPLSDFAKTGSDVAETSNSLLAEQQTRALLNIFLVQLNTVALKKHHEDISKVIGILQCESHERMLSSIAQYENAESMTESMKKIRELVAERQLNPLSAPDILVFWPVLIELINKTNDHDDYHLVTDFIELNQNRLGADAIGQLDWKSYLRDYAYTSFFGFMMDGDVRLITPDYHKHARSIEDVIFYLHILTLTKLISDGPRTPLSLFRTNYLDDVVRYVRRIMDDLGSDPSKIETIKKELDVLVPAGSPKRIYLQFISDIFDITLANRTPDEKTEGEQLEIPERLIELTTAEKAANVIKNFSSVWSVTGLPSRWGLNQYFTDTRFSRGVFTPFVDALCTDTSFYIDLFRICYRRDLRGLSQVPILAYMFEHIYPGIFPDGEDYQILPGSNGHLYFWCKYLVEQRRDVLYGLFATFTSPVVRTDLDLGPHEDPYQAKRAYKEHVVDFMGDFFERARVSGTLEENPLITEIGVSTGHSCQHYLKEAKRTYPHVLFRGTDIVHYPDSVLKDDEFILHDILSSPLPLRPDVIVFVNVNVHLSPGHFDTQKISGGGREKAWKNILSSAKEGTVIISGTDEFEYWIVENRRLVQVQNAEEAIERIAGIRLQHRTISTPVSPHSRAS
ncbi:MAG: hypothetical protein JW774_10350 [Candidatus Aureabacteria bacterium]|nr:hypothetical protein [Candidatus Auribacterota bacterium]